MHVMPTLQGWHCSYILGERWSVCSLEHHQETELEHVCAWSIQLLESNTRLTLNQLAGTTISDWTLDVGCIIGLANEFTGIP